MPGAQVEEPAVEEERSEPVQVGGGALLGTDDLEDVSDEEMDWSNDEENIRIVEESIDEEEQEPTFICPSLLSILPSIRQVQNGNLEICSQ